QDNAIGANLQGALMRMSILLMMPVDDASDADCCCYRRHGSHLMLTHLAGARTLLYVVGNLELSWDYTEALTKPGHDLEDVALAELTNHCQKKSRDYGPRAFVFTCESFTNFAFGMDLTQGLKRLQNARPERSGHNSPIESGSTSVSIEYK
ncbi:hypothetical protein Tco_0412032, partial [Tanacetum coccineum]